MPPLPRRSTVTVRHDSTFRPTGICRGCTADERKHLESVPPIHTTEFRNVIVRNDTLHVYLDAADERSQYWTGQLRGHLSARALGAKDSAALGRRIAVQVHNQPVWCSQWDDVTAVFIRPRILTNICHMMNENILPLLEVLNGTTSPVELFTFPGHHSDKPLPHWRLFTERLATTTAPAAALFALGGERCVSRLLWGSGRKPFYNSFRVEPFREQLRRLRRMLLAPQLTPTPFDTAPRRAIWIQRKRGLQRGLRSLGDVEALLARGEIRGRGWEPRVVACCDFASPLREQVRVISGADLIVGLHGAGLTNVLFARRGALLLEYKGFYGITDFVYRKMVQLVHGGFVAVRADENARAHLISPLQAAVGVQCVDALLSAEPERLARCARLPYVMQVWPVGHDDDCSFAEWAPKPPPICPPPSHLLRLGGGCWRWYAHATLARPNHSRCTHAHATLEEATSACSERYASWCAGVTRVPPKRGSPCGRYRLRTLPLRPYDGTITLHVSWVRQNASQCLVPEIET